MGGQGLDTFEYFGGGWVRAAGHFATIDEGEGGRGGSSVDLSLFDLTTGKVVHRWSCCMGGETGLDDLVLHPGGAMAWIDWNGTQLEVRKSDRDGDAIVLDSDTTTKSGGPDIARRSLSLNGDVVSWLRPSGSRSAELRP
jgi:hypothetical protein